MASRLAIALDLARRFLGWWFAELAFLVPPLLRKRLAGGDGVALTLAADQATLTHEAGGKARVLGEFRTAAPGAGAQLHALLGRVPGLRQRVARGRVPVALRLPATQALRTAVTLPLAAEANLRQALMFQLDRRTPFSADSVYFAHRVLARDDAAKQLEVELAVVPRNVVAAALSTGRTLGLAPSAVQIAAANASDAPSGNLLPDEERPRRRPATLVTRAALAALVVAGLVAAYEPIHAARRAADDLQARVQAAKELALRGRKLKEEVARLTEAQQFLVGGKNETPSATELLYELTRVLPDDTWLQEVHVGAGEIIIGGFSKSASRLIELLERSGVFVNPQFRSAVTQDQASGKERFELTARIAKKAAAKAAAGSLS